MLLILSKKISVYFLPLESLIKARKIEATSDQMQEQISTYLAECTKHELSFESSKGAAAMMRLTSELESIGDSIFNLFLHIEKAENDLKFNDEMNTEIMGLYDFVEEFIQWNHLFIQNNIQVMSEDELVKSIDFEKGIDRTRNILLDSSRKRLTNESNLKSELLYMDIIKHLEHIGDYSLNISQALEQIN